MYKIGDEVRLKYTGDLAVIKRLYPGEDMYMAEIVHTREELPVFEDDIILAELFTGVEKVEKPKKANANPLKSKTPSTAELFGYFEDDLPETSQSLEKELPNLPLSQQKRVFDSDKEEAYLALCEMGGSHCIYIVNNSRFGLNFEFSHALPDGRMLNSVKPYIEPKSYVAVGEVIFTPEIADVLTCSIKSFEVGKRTQLKHKHLVTQSGLIPLMGVVGLAFPLMVPFKRQPTESLKEYAKQQVPKPQKISTYQRFDVGRKAHFPVDIDLHIENLTQLHSKMSEADKLKLQIRAFEDYLAEAIELGVERCFIIHGIGEGKLKKIIHDKLASNRQVVKFTNEHHHKYGFGATEVRL